MEELKKVVGVGFSLLRLVLHICGNAAIVLPGIALVLMALILLGTL
jgi:hypothetical protein